MAKFKYPAKPKAPKASAPAASHERFHEKMKAWGKECQEVDRRKAEHERMVKKTADLKNGKGLSGRKR